MKARHATTASLLAAITLTLTAPALHAAALTWDAATGDGAAVTAGTGNWNTTAGNLVWNDGVTPNVSWSQTSTTDGSNSAIFAGDDGTTDQYVVTLGAQMAAEAVTFNSSGYKITGSTLALMPTTTTNGGITVAAGKTATINSILGYVHNTSATIAVGSEGVLNLGGGVIGTNNRPQWNFSGAGTINLNGGAFHNTIGSLNTASINLTAGSHLMSDQSANVSTSIGNNAGRNVAYTVSGSGTLNVVANNTTAPAYTVSLGRNMGNFKSTLAIKTGGTVNVGVTSSRAGLLNLGSYDANGNSLLEVQGGTLTVGTGKPINKLYFFAAGANAGKTATMTQSGGTATLNGIQFGANTGDTAGGLNGANGYDGTALATLQLSGGNLYIGAQNITRGTAAAALPVTIQLQGGTIGASANWSSALDMKLGTSGGGVTFLAADSGGTARNITLSGILSNDGAVDGSLTKTGAGTLTLSGANSYSGATTINAGTLALGASNVLPGASAVSIGTATLDAATFTDTAGTLDAAGGATINLGAGATLAFADSSAIDWTDGTLNITGTFTPGVSLRFGTTNAGLTPSQLLLISATGYSDFMLTEDGYLTVADSTPPTLTSIVDNKDAGPIAEFTTVTYTVTFNEPMKAGSFDSDDFVNAGTAECYIGTITQISPTVFTVQATPNTPGTLLLRIPATATITDAVGNALDSDPPLDDDTTLTVNNSSAPVLLASGIVDDKAGEPVSPTMVVTYTVTFSEDMDDTTVEAEDFGNAGTATFTIGTVTETAPGVFTVPVTPTGTGTLQLKVNANAVLRAAASGNVMNTTSAIVDDAVISIRDYVLWDTVGGNGATIDAGSGNWNTAPPENTVWNNAGVNEAWTQSRTTVPLRDAVFAGVDGVAESYVVTLDTGSQIAAKTLNFRNTGYNITGGTVYLPVPTPTTTPTIAVVADKSATINSAIKYAANTVVYTTVGANGTLNLGGGYSSGAVPQPRWSGAGAINMTAGSFVSNSTILNAAEMNQLAGTTVSSPYQIWINNNAGRDTGYTISGGTMSLNAPDTNRTLGLVLGCASGSYIGKFTVKSAATVTIGTTASNYGYLAIVGVIGDGCGVFDVQGGTVTVGNSQASNQIYLFKDGANPGRTAAMTQSGGVVTTPGIQFGNTTGTYAASASATLQLSGGYLFVGGLGITRGSAAADLPIAIQLSGGTLACSAADWSSSLDMKLGTSGGGVTIQAADSVGAARNITLSGNLADDGAANGGFTKTGGGTLALSGICTYSGNTTVNAGTLTLSNAPDPENANTGNDASTVTVGAAAILNLAYTGTDKVDKLYIGTTQKAAGVYGKEGSAFPIIGIPQITGDGTLTVATGPVGFSGWITGTFAGGATVPSGKQGPKDDPDNDGIPNLVEYAIAGQDPTVGNAIIGTFTNNTLGFTKRTDANGLTYAIVESTDLGMNDDWAEVTGTPPTYINNVTTISYALTPGSPVRNFIRLKVTQTP